MNTEKKIGGFKQIEDLKNVGGIGEAKFDAIKEAISAVEVSARQITCTKTLDDAFKKLVEIHPMIKNSMEKLYHYTNQKDTGIRHGWMEQSAEPTINEAIFILVTSCSFINYLNKVYCNSQNK